MAQKPTKFERPDGVTNQDANDEGGISVMRNVRLIAIVGVILMVVAAGVLYWRYSASSANERAQLELARIRSYYDKGELTVAINGDSSKSINGDRIRGLEEIVEDWSSTPAGKISALYLGNCYIAINQLDKASDAYTIASESDNNLIQVGAHAGIAAVAEAEGDYGKAAEEYAKSADMDQLELKSADYYLAAARNYEQAGKNEEAIEFYRKVATQFALSQANTEARLALARHNVDI